VTWRLFAYKDGDPHGESDMRRMCADWQVHDTVQRCMDRGYDNILLDRDDDAPQWPVRGLLNPGDGQERTPRSSGEAAGVDGDAGGAATPVPAGA
jgi:hypothetical protein